MASVTIALDEVQLTRFREPARLLGITPEELARLSFLDFLDQTDEEMDVIIREILDERPGLIHRLAQ